MLFKDRRDAGIQLAKKLKPYAGQPDLLVLGLPRGGVPVAYEVAKAFQAPLDVFVVRKLGAPGQEELAMGAISSGGVRVVNKQIIHALNVSQNALEAVTVREQRELERRERMYRGDHPGHPVQGRTVILVDDGLATGASMRAAVTALQKQKPNRIIIAVPVAAPDTCASFENLADDVVCLATPASFGSVGAWYEDFAQTTDGEVRELLDKAETVSA